MLDGEKLRRLRLSRGLDQRGLAAKVGIKQPTLSGYERNSIANPKSENVRKLAEFYGVSIEDLMLPEPADPGPEPMTDREALAELLALWNRMTPDRRRVVLEVARAMPTNGPDSDG